MNDGIGEIILGRQAWLPWALGVFLLLTLIGLLSYRGVRSVRVLATGLLLRSIGLATLLFCMLEPMRSLRVPKPQANTIAVLVDNSRSMRSLYQRPLQGSEKPRDSISASDLARESADAMKGVEIGRAHV